MLKRVADMQLPCGTPFFVVYLFELAVPGYEVRAVG